MARADVDTAPTAPTAAHGRCRPASLGLSCLVGGVTVAAGLAQMTVSAIRAKARTDAAQILVRHWGDAVPVDPVKIARKLGVSVFSAQLGEDTWGMLIGSPNGVDMYLDREQP